MVADLPETSRVRIMIEGNENLEEIVKQARLEKKCLYSFDDKLQNGETGKELLCKFGYTDLLKESNLEDRQRMYGFMIQIESVAEELAADESD